MSNTTKARPKINNNNRNNSRMNNNDNRNNNNKIKNNRFPLLRRSDPRPCTFAYFVGKRSQSVMDGPILCCTLTLEREKPQTVYYLAFFEVLNCI